MHSNTIIFMVSYGNVRVITTGNNREDAKRNAANWISYQDAYSGGAFRPSTDEYTVTPLTNPGDRIKLDISLRV
jgi:hypothetical protein